MQTGKRERERERNRKWHQHIREEKWGRGGSLNPTKEKNMDERWTSEDRPGKAYQTGVN